MADDIREVFISYHEKSAGEYVAKLADRLESAGISCWYAKRDLPSGGDFARDIPPKISDCKVFLLILNEGANNSRHVENEVGLAYRRYNKREEITILPYQVEKCDFSNWLDFYLIHIQKQSVETMDMGALVTEVAHKLGREPMKNGFCGPGARWTLKDGVLTISKYEYVVDSGKMGDFYFQNIPESVNAPWWNEQKKIVSVIIKNGITNIGKETFRFCGKLTSVDIPDSVTSIGDAAFFGCSELPSVNIPDSVVRIGDAAFHSCSKLPSVNIPDSVTSIGELAFYKCSGLTGINIPDNVTSIGDLTFYECSGLTSIRIPDSVTSIGYFAFYGCSGLTSVDIPDSVSSIDEKAFGACSNLTSVSVPANAKIADDAFDPTTEVIRRPPR